MTDNLPQVIDKNEIQRDDFKERNSLFFNPGMFEQAQRAAKMLYNSSMVPEHIKGKTPEQGIANIVIALNMASRMQLDPFMVMQSMYVIHGKPGIEAKLAIACVNMSGRFTPLQYEMGGEGQTRYCIAFSVDKASGNECRGPRVDMAMAKAEGWSGKAGSKWATMPDLMLTYRAAMFFARTFCPETILGMQSREELQDVYEMPRKRVQVGNDVPDGFFCFCSILQRNVTEADCIKCDDVGACPMPTDEMVAKAHESKK